MSFDQFNLDSRLVRGVQDAGYKTPTPIQEQAIPKVLSGRDVLGLAQTGTGKTAAFMLPILQRLTQGSLRKLRVLVVAPTRELAEQIHVASQGLAKYTKIRSMTMYGGIGKGKQREELKRGVEIIIACPGRFLDMQKEARIDLSDIEVLVLDEADHMCDMGFMPDIKRIVKLLPKKRQTLFFSATMPSEIRELTRTILDDPVTVQIGTSAPAETVAHSLFHLPESTKVKQALLFHILKSEAVGRALVFTRTKRRAKVLAQKLEQKGHKVSALQGNMSQNARQRAMDGYRSGKFDILVATDIAARGIDVSEISHVINFDMVNTVDAYTHRIGRTGRAQHTGKAYTFVTREDSDMLRRIERELRKKINVLPLPEGLEAAIKAEASEEALPVARQQQGGRKPSRTKARGGGFGGRQPQSAGNSARRPAAGANRGRR
ncbi:MAG: ATP-dependent RNA helicase RhlE [Cellvibrionaceae bacterium]